MGVPKLFRYLVERYPLILKDCKANATHPIFDNLYLDFNGIIHKCSHPNQDEESTSNEKQIMFAVFAYIEKIMSIVQPQKVLFIAVDGVAPRAKMNQQRQRRFRVAFDKFKRNQQKNDNSSSTPEDSNATFDSNCITPGTEFMQKMTNHLKFYIQHKLDHDKSWQNLTVILSGPEVAGEGEHKIMEYIRQQQKLPNYDINTSHCLYGLDADLIALALALHEPYFTIVREKVVFRKKQNSRKEIAFQQTDDFQFLSVSLLREYIEAEFKSHIKSFQYNAERIIDDVVFLCFLVGNDFIPCLPYLDIDYSGLDKIFNTYKSLISSWKGYLVNAASGKVRLDAVMEIIANLIQYEHSAIKEKIVAVNTSKETKEDEEEEEEAPETKAPMNKNTAMLNKPAEEKRDPKAKPTSAWAKPLGSKPTPAEERKEDKPAPQEEPKKEEPKPAPEPAEVEPEKKPSTENSNQQVPSATEQPSSESVAFIQSLHLETALRSLLGIVPLQVAAPTSQNVVVTDEMVSEFKSKYYSYRISGTTTESAVPDITKIRRMSINYVEGLVWTLNYYYHGHLSWKWFYEYHTAPFVSDLSLLKDDLQSIKLQFDMGKPFLPFQQLLAVLPRASKDLLPASLQKLMTEENSPIISFYPTEYEFIEDEKNREWKNIAKIPFIDETKLVEAYETVAKDSNAFSPEETKRNSFGRTHLFSYDPNVKTKPLTSPFLPQAESNANENTTTTAPAKGKGKKLAAAPESNVPVSHCKLEFIDLPKQAEVVPEEAQPKSEETKEKRSSLPPKCIPTLHTIPFLTEFRKANVNTVGSASRGVSAIIKLFPQEEETFGAEHIVSKYLGKFCYVFWPYNTLAKIIQITSCSTQQHFYVSGRGNTTSTATGSDWKDSLKKLQDQYLSRQGIDISDASNFILHVQPFEQMTRKNNMRVRSFQNEQVMVPLSATILSEVLVQGLMLNDPRSSESSATIGNEFSTGSKAVYIAAGQYYGSVGTITNSTQLKDGYEYDLELDVYPADPQHGHQVVTSVKEKYTAAGEVAAQLGISGLALSRISGTLTCSPGDVDLGLGMKYSRRDLVVIGFTRKTKVGNENNPRTIWEYSEQAVKLLHEFKATFPQLFEQVNKDPSQDVFDGIKIFGEKHSEVMNQVSQWIAKSPVTKLPLLPGDTRTVSPQALQLIQERTQEFSQKLPKTFKKQVLKSIPSNCIINSSVARETLPSTRTHAQKFELGDRVINVSDTGSVPFGLRGTVVTLHQNVCEVIFDEEFLAGTNLNNRLDTLRGATIPISTLINITHPHATIQAPQPAAKGKQSKAPQQKHVSSNPFDMLLDSDE